MAVESGEGVSAVHDRKPSGLIGLKLPSEPPAGIFRKQREGAALLKPESEEQLAEMVRSANGPLSVRGGGTRHVPGDGEALSNEGF